MVMIILCICSQLEVNDIVGKEIDSLEARKYYLFTDVEDFVSACFNDSGDSIIVGMNFVRNETIQDSSAGIQDASSFLYRSSASSTVLARPRT